MMNRVIFFVKIFAGIFLLLSCKEEEEEKLLIGFSQCAMNDDWRLTMYDEVYREMIFHDDMELLFKNADGKNQRQAEQIEELVEAGVELLIVSPNEAEPLIPVLEEVRQKGIPVILIDRKVNSDVYTAFVGGNNFLIGKEAAHYIAKLIGGKGKVLEAYEYFSITPFRERNKGFWEGMAEYPEIEVDSVRAMAVGVEQFKTMILQTEYDAVFAHTDIAAHYAYDIAQELGVADKIKFIGVDGLAFPGGGMELVNEGKLTASFLYPTGGDVAIRLSADILGGRKIERQNYLPTTVIDSTNVSIMITQARKLLTQQADIQKLGSKLNELVSVFQSQKTMIYMLTVITIFAILLMAIAYYSLNEKKRINKELALKNKEVITMSLMAEEATQAKFRFFTNISHEFRTPLTLLLGPVEELLATEKSQKVKKDLIFIQRNAHRLLRLINQLMDFRKVENNMMRLKATEQNLVYFIKEIMSSFDKVAENRKIEFKLISEEPVVNLWFDTDMMDKVLFNLLSNAFKFTTDLGYIHIKVQINGLKNVVAIVVEDNGRGMTPDQIEHAFERFYQGETYSTIEGTGLGLSLSKELIQLHGGSIGLKSQVDQGTRFEISLPLGMDHLDKESIVKEAVRKDELKERLVIDDEEYQSERDESLSHAEYSILLIEDNHDLREFLNSKLSKSFQIIEAEDGEAGVFKATQLVPDLIICDLTLPKKNGHQVLKELKSDLKTSHIPFILLTARENIEDKVVGIQEGADDYITKPFNFRYLAERIRMTLLNRQKLREHFLHQVPNENGPISSNHLDKKFANDFIALVEEHFANNKFGVNELCDKMGMSRIQLYRKVKALLGYSINDYINMVRLKKASHLLKNSDHSISEIAYQVGYSSPAYFSTAFKANFGSTPKEFKAS